MDRAFSPSLSWAWIVHFSGRCLPLCGICDAAGIDRAFGPDLLKAERLKGDGLKPGAGSWMSSERILREKLVAAQSTKL